MEKTPPRKETEYWSNNTLPWVPIADLMADGTINVTNGCVNSLTVETHLEEKSARLVHC